MVELGARQLWVSVVAADLSLAYAFIERSYVIVKCGDRAGCLAECAMINDIMNVTFHKHSKHMRTKSD